MLIISGTKWSGFNVPKITLADYFSLCVRPVWTISSKIFFILNSSSTKCCTAVFWPGYLATDSRVNPNKFKQKEIYCVVLESVQSFLEYQEIRYGECRAGSSEAERNVLMYTVTVLLGQFCCCLLITQHLSMGWRPDRFVSASTASKHQWSPCLL